LVAFAVPFDTPRGRRVFSGGLQVQNSPLGSYLGHAVALPSSRVYLIDPDGKVVASDPPLADDLAAGDPALAGALSRNASGAFRDAGQDWFYSAQPVTGTPWRIVATVPTPVLYAPARDPRVWRATMVAVVALAGLLGVFGAARSRRSRWLLSESEQRFREVFDNSLIGMAITAPTRQMLRVNRALCAMLGHTEQKLLTTTFEEITHPDDRGLIKAAIDDAVAGRTNGFSAERRYLHADGHTVHTSLTTSLLRDHDGAPLYFATQIVDVTEQKTFEAVQRATNIQLREANQRVADLVAMLSHDVRQPLGVITGYTDTVISDWDTISNVRRLDFLARVAAAARRMTILVEDILALTHLDTGTVQPRRATVDVVHALTEAITHLPDEQAHAITVAHPDRQADAVVDPGHLQQILINLLGNATKYGSVPIDAMVTATDEAVEITVADHGEGVPDDFVPHLFERFTRATTGVTVTQKGTGLGLYIVAQLAHANHATVSYQPNQPSGARFTLRLIAAQYAERDEGAETPDVAGLPRPAQGRKR
jgi:PAS domain S-box-containing protein